MYCQQKPAPNIRNRHKYSNFVEITSDCPCEDDGQDDHRDAAHRVRHDSGLQPEHLLLKELPE